jgi:hypothetical protein
LNSFLRPAHGKPLLVLPLWTTLLWLVARQAVIGVAAVVVLVAC